MSDIFISYAREDRPKAKQLAEILERQGWSVWWDRTIPAGKSYDEVIDEAIKNTDTIIVLWSGISVKKNWVLEEAQDGMDRNILIPVLIEQVELPRGFRRIQAADLVGWDGSTSAAGFVRLVQDIEAVIGAPSVSRSSMKQSQEQPERKIPKPEAQVQEKHSVASVSSVHLKIPQRMVNWPALPIRFSRNTVLFTLTVVALIVGGLFVATRSNSIPEPPLPATAKVDQDAYAEGVKLYDVGKYAEAYPLFLKAAGKGNTAAQCFLGYMCRSGLGTVQNDIEALKWYRLAAAKEDVVAQNNLGLMFLDGIGVPQNDAEAVKCFRDAAEKGLAVSQYHLALMYLKGKGVNQSDPVALTWFRQAAVQGNVKAQNYLGFMYEKGKGVKRDDKEAVRWYRESAMRGYAKAQYKLGLMYESGRGVARSKKDAVDWFRKAALQGYADAERKL